LSAVLGTGKEGRNDRTLHLGTPNGRKASIMLEEIGLPYNVHTMNLAKNE